MKKLCSKHGSYPAKHPRCPQCVKESWKHRDSTDDRGYDSDWRKFRKAVMQHVLYTFCWLSLIENGKMVTKNLQLHHIKPIKDFPELRMVRSNVVPLCREKHLSLEQSLKRGGVQPDWDAIKEKVGEVITGISRN
jgi:5-methylcytosine-specific restriction endonuclease McrA